MAITQTGAMYKSLSFDNTSSRSYGVYITGQAVFNAPERDVEMISIPGRNGAFALDRGRFENITVTYPAGIFAENEADFAQAISDFRNFLCSKKGYCRLTDEYNPSEYRMAIYKSGLEVEPAQLRAGEFEITFECKPQRFLTSGEVAVTSTGSSIEITNPTLFDAKPLFIASGNFATAQIELNNSKFNPYEIVLNNDDTGIIDLYDPEFTYNVNYNDDDFNSTDEISIELGSIGLKFRSISTLEILSCTKESGGTLNSTATTTEVYDAGVRKNVPAVVFAISQTLTYQVGTGVDKTDTYTVRVKRTPASGTAVTTAYVIEVKAKSYTDHFTVSARKTNASPTDSAIKLVNYETTPKVIISATGYSTVPAFSGDIYIDAELGEVYKYNSDDEIVPLNRYVSLPSELPVLTPGANEVIFYGLDSLSVTPRWWKI